MRRGEGGEFKDWVQVFLCPVSSTFKPKGEPRRWDPRQAGHTDQRIYRGAAWLVCNANQVKVGSDLTDQSNVVRRPALFRDRGLFSGTG